MPAFSAWRRDRKLVQWGIGYAAVSWIAYEVLSLLSENFAWPPAIIRSITVLLAVGLLVTLVLAWYHGEQGRQSVAASELLLLTVLGVLAVAGVARVSRPASEAPARAATEDGVAATNSIAVLPLESLSDNRDDAYFADGVHEEILTHLSRVEGLKVISRTSVLQYRKRTSSLREIAQALGVATVLEGSVRRAGGRIRVTAQLINARTDEHLWAENYDGDVAQVFEIQQEIARKIVGALRVRLAPAAAAETKRPTENAAAYESYLQARVYHSRAGNTAPNLRAAELLYQRAIQEDPDFALAHARLSEIHARIYWFSHDRTPARIALAKTSLERVIALAPDAPETHYSAGLYYYWCHRDYDRAEAEFRTALASMPGNGEVLAALAFVQRRRGEWQVSNTNLERAVELDPRNANLLGNLAYSYASLQRYPEAVRTYDRAVAVAPEAHLYTYSRAYTFMAWRGDTDSIAAVLDRLPKDFQPTTQPIAPRVQLALMRGDNAAALTATQTLPEVVEMQTYSPRTLIAGVVHDARGDSAAARLNYDSARVILQAALRKRSADPRMHASLGYAFAGLGSRAEAIRHGERAVELLPRERDPSEGALLEWNLAAIHARLGDEEVALELIDSLRTMVPVPSPHVLGLDPLFARLRGNPRFRQILADLNKRNEMR